MVCLVRTSVQCPPHRHVRGLGVWVAATPKKLCLRIHEPSLVVFLFGESLIIMTFLAI